MHGKLDRIGFVFAVTIIQPFAAVDEVAGGQGSRQVRVVETQGIVFTVVGTHSGIGLGKPAVVVSADIYGGHAFIQLVALQIACGSEGRGEKEGED